MTEYSYNVGAKHSRQALVIGHRIFMKAHPFLAGSMFSGSQVEAVPGQTSKKGLPLFKVTFRRGLGGGL